MLKYALIVILILNLISFTLMGIDKRLAIAGKRRIPESSLLFWGFLMGGPGLLLGSLVFHHKTRKWKFRLGIPAALIVNVLVAVILLSAFVCYDVRSDIAYKTGYDCTIDSATAAELKDGGYQCALVLGCAVYADGEPSAMLRDRLDTGIMLYKEGIVPKLLLSGDHGQVEYDEISVMYNYCLEAGVPSDDIFLDHAGFSTYDSVYRAQSVFCVESMIVVTQTYHEFRALYTAEQLGIDAAGVSSDQQSYAGATYREVREVLARAKDFFKVLVKAPPVYGGDRIPITGSPEMSHV